MNPDTDNTIDQEPDGSYGEIPATKPPSQKKGAPFRAITELEPPPEPEKKPGPVRPLIQRSKNLEVHTFQVNVPLGDCAIHLLVKDAAQYTASGPQTVPEKDMSNRPQYGDDQSPPTLTYFPWDMPKHRRGAPRVRPGTTGKRGTVIAALLFDGGHDNIGVIQSTIASKRIEKAIKDIERDYRFDYKSSPNAKRQQIGVEGTPLREGYINRNRQLIFDAWIITHWDRDHYCGSVRMIHDDLVRQYNSKSKTKKRLRSSYFRYSTGLDDAQSCGSVLYCPSWTRPTDADLKKMKEEKAKKKKERAEAKAKGIKLPRKPRKKKGDPSNPASAEEDKPKGAPLIFLADLTPDGCAQMKAVVNPAKRSAAQGSGEPLAMRKFPDNVAVTSERLFRVMCEPDDFIGYDFFTGLHCAKPAGTDATNSPDTKPPSGWWKDANHNIKSVCANAPQTDEDHPWPVFLCLGGAGWIFGRTAIVDMTGASHYTMDNYYSILAVLAWPTATGRPRLSHFCGGDAHMMTERAILSFFRDTDASTLTNPKSYPIEILKAAHHGARTSTPSNMLIQCRPQKFVISAGANYGHPSM